ncbi:MAG: hypothetical protein ABIJ21_09505 [Nanoarchaeota archaeon]
MNLETAVAQFPFLSQVKTDYQRIPVTVIVRKVDAYFLQERLVEEDSEAAGHTRVSIDLYVVRDDLVSLVDVQRTTRRIYPPAYLHEYDDFPPDQDGWSETVGDSLSRESPGFRYILLHVREYDGMGVGKNVLEVREQSI